MSSSSMRNPFSKRILFIRVYQSYATINSVFFLSAGSAAWSLVKDDGGIILFMNASLFFSPLTHAYF